MPDTNANAATSWPTPEGFVRRGMKVIAPDGTCLGTVASVENGEVLLADDDSFVSVTQIDGISADAVLLADRGDATFGLGAQP